MSQLDVNTISPRTGTEVGLGAGNTLAADAVKANTIAPRAGSEVGVLSGNTLATDALKSNTLAARTGTTVTVDPTHTLVATAVQSTSVAVPGALLANASQVNISKPVTVTTSVTHTPVVVVSSTGILLDFSTGNSQTLTLGANPTFTFTGINAMSPCLLYIDPNGSARTLTWPAGVKWTGTALTALTSGNHYLVTITYTGAVYLLTGTEFT